MLIHFRFLLASSIILPIKVVVKKQRQLVVTCTRLTYSGYKKYTPPFKMTDFCEVKHPETV